jgi:purine-binding chemotaxis protein CheW
MSSSITGGRSLLACRVGSYVCGIPLEHVTETMRPLPVKAIASVPVFVRGISVIHGETVPVLDVGLLIGAEPGTPTRFVTIDVAGRVVALSVDGVMGIQEVGGDVLREIPSLLNGASGDAIAALSTLDSELMVVLESTRLVSDSLWAVFDRELSS